MRRVLSLLLCMALVASACSGSDPDDSAPDDSAPDDNGAASTTTTDSTGRSDPDDSGGDGTSDPSSDDQAADGAAADGLNWEQCAQLECSSIEVPIDHSSGSESGSLEIELARSTAEGSDAEYRGVLLINPGGPGVSAVDFLELAAGGYLPDEITDSFDLVAFDPRGVGNSEPEFGCGLDGDHLVIANAIEGNVDTPEEIELAELAIEQCVETMGEVAGLLHTEFVARDMDLVREALGVEQITYLGFSYGSLIGVYYASIFPDRVRAMVVDGADNPLDPSDTAEQRVESAMQELAPLEDRLRAALEACDDATCPIWNDGDPIAYYEQASEKLELVDDYLGDVPLSGALGIITTLYSEQTWPLLWDALEDLVEFDDGSLLGELALFQLDDPGQPSFTGHVNCLDGWSLFPNVDRSARISDADLLSEQIATELPLLALIDEAAFDRCPFLDTIAPPPLSFELDGGSVPIVVVGNREDPVTPFVESEELVLDTLANGRLIEVSHPEHTVYPNNECVNDLVTRTLLDASPPPDQVTSC